MATAVPDASNQMGTVVGRWTHPPKRLGRRHGFAPSNATPGPGNHALQPASFVRYVQRVDGLPRRSVPPYQRRRIHIRDARHEVAQGCPRVCFSASHPKGTMSRRTAVKRSRSEDNPDAVRDRKTVCANRDKESLQSVCSAGCGRVIMFWAAAVCFRGTCAAMTRRSS